MNHELKALLNHPGWKSYIQLLQDEFDLFYKRLRKTSKTKQMSESKYDHINGYLDGIEKAQRILEEYIQESQQVEENQPGQEEQ